MFIRLVRTTGSADPELRHKSLEAWRANVHPRLRAQPGYLGAVVMAAIGTGDGVTVTYWQDHQALEASSALAAQLQEDAPLPARRTITEVDVFQLVFAERAKPIAAPAFLRSNDLIADLASVDSGLAFVRERVYPALRDQLGFRSLVCGANGDTGRVILTSTWDRMQDLERSEAAILDLRRPGLEAAGAGEVRVEKWEVLMAAVPIQAGIRT